MGFVTLCFCTLLQSGVHCPCATNCFLGIFFAAVFTHCTTLFPVPSCTAARCSTHGCYDIVLMSIASVMCPCATVCFLVFSSFCFHILHSTSLIMSPVLVLLSTVPVLGPVTLCFCLLLQSCVLCLCAAVLLKFFQISHSALHVFSHMSHYCTAVNCSSLWYCDLVLATVPVMGPLSVRYCLLLRCFFCSVFTHCTILLWSCVPFLYCCSLL